MTITKKTSMVRGIRTALNIFYYLSIILIIFFSIFAIAKGFSYEPKDGRFEVTYYSSSPGSFKVAFINNHAEEVKITIAPGMISFDAKRSFLIFINS